MIENIKYKILNKSEKETEVLPQVGQTYELLVRCFPEDSEITTATITAGDVTRMGSYYTRVIGRATVEGYEGLPADATYEIRRVYPEFTEIGELTLKKFSEI